MNQKINEPHPRLRAVRDELATLMGWDAPGFGSLAG